MVSRYPVQQPRVWRSRRNKLVAGVVGGLAEKFGIEPNLLRVIYVAVSVMSVAFPGILVYLVLWAVLSPWDEMEG